MCNHHVSDKVTIDFNMLHSLMKNKIIDNIHSRLLVTIHYYWLVINNTHFRKERLNPHQFTRYMSHGSIFSLSTISRPNILFFIASNKNTIINNRTTINKITITISIRISHNIQMKGKSIIHPFT